MTAPSRNPWAGKKVEESILWVGIKEMLPCFLHCNAFIVLIALCSCFSCGVCYHKHFISPFQECPLFALVQKSPCKMIPFTPKWDKLTSAVIVHWDKVGAVCFYLLPWATTSAAIATSSIHQWHWCENKHWLYYSKLAGLHLWKRKGKAKTKLNSYHFPSVSAVRAGIPLYNGSICKMWGNFKWKKPCRIRKIVFCS